MDIDSRSLPERLDEPPDVAACLLGTLVVRAVSDAVEDDHARASQALVVDAAGGDVDHAVAVAPQQERVGVDLLEAGREVGVALEQVVPDLRVELGAADELLGQVPPNGLGDRWRPRG